ncbi:MAG: hypothetical protein Q4C49_00025 [Bacillota bacterium]|nr:hypothetical protein [Bacillota bacterium]
MGKNVTILTNPEKDQFVENETDLQYDDTKAVEGLNFEAGVPLEIGTPYLVVPQENTGKRYHIDGEDVVSKRFLSTELDENMSALTGVARTIGLSSIRGMHVGLVVDGQPAPKFDTKLEDGRRKAIVSKWSHATEDTSFIRGDLDTMRAVVTKPVIIIPVSRGGVYTLEYDRNSKSVKVDGKNKAVPTVNDRFYTFKVVDNVSAALVKQATDALKAAYPNNFFPKA